MFSFVRQKMQFIFDNIPRRFTHATDIGDGDCVLKPRMVKMDLFEWYMLIVNIVYPFALSPSKGEPFGLDQNRKWKDERINRR